MTTKRNPAPRTIIKNFRVSQAESDRLDEHARQNGFRSTSDFIRAQLLRPGRFKENKGV